MRDARYTEGMTGADTTCEPLPQSPGGRVLRASDAVAAKDPARLRTALDALTAEERTRELSGLLTETLWRKFWEGTRLILEMGAGAEALKDRGRDVMTSCAEAARADWPAATEVARLVLESGMNWKLCGTLGDPLLAHVATEGNADLVRLLLTHEAAPGFCESGNLVHRVVRNAKNETDLLAVLDALRAGGVDLGVRCRAERRTALHEAAYMALPRASAYLCEQGLSAVNRAKGDISPLHLLGSGLGRGMPEAEKLERARATIKALVAHGADLDTTAESGDTPFIAATQTSPGIAQALLEAGADLNGRSRAGFTALHVAASRNRVQMVRFLLERGADAGLLTSSGDTPLMLARRGVHSEAESLIEAMLQQRALEAAIPEAGTRSRNRV